MEYTKIDPHVQSRLQNGLVSYSIEKIIHELHAAGATVLLVGGAVRDLLLDLPLKDLDIEVHGLSPSELEAILSQFGPVSVVGKAYGVFRIHGINVDWSLPRTDAQGRKPEVTIDPHMNLHDAFARRDLTINAMGINLITYELIDPFGGLDDVHKGILRAPDESKFVEDPLRFFRVMQFIARFGFTPTEQLNTLCRSMDISTVSRERIEEECRKTLLLSSSPSRAFRWLDSIGRLVEIFPELAALKGVKQGERWHPEGDVLEHTMQTIDAAACLSCDTDEQKLLLMYAALCHDLGKVSTTDVHEDGSITSYEHEVEGARLAHKLLKRITNNKDVIATVVKLVRYHMQPLVLVQQGAKRNAYKRLAHKLAPEATLAMLGLLALADRRGRNPQGHEPLTICDEGIDQFVKRAHEADVFTKVEEPILQGRDIMDVVSPGPEMGDILHHAYEIQIEESITDKEELKRRVLKSLS